VRLNQPLYLRIKALVWNPHEQALDVKRIHDDRLQTFDQIINPSLIPDPDQR
jgi:hypothetical protein